jgi:multidrug efflux pump subunit AcrA (membrane-fusion protein)
LVFALGWRFLPAWFLLVLFAIWGASVIADSPQFSALSTQSCPSEKVGVWQIVDGDLHFSPVKLGTSDLNGYVQVREGLKNGDQVVTYSEKALTARSRIHVVDHIPGVSR